MNSKPKGNSTMASTKTVSDLNNAFEPVRYVATYDLGIGGGQEVDEVDEEMESILRSVGYVD